MKNWWLLVLLIFIIACSSIYLLIPGELTLAEARGVQCNERGAYRRLTEETCWDRWWPQGRPVSMPYCGTDRHPFIYHGYSFKVTGVFLKGINVWVQQGDFGFATSLTIVSLPDPDSVILEWGGHFGSSLNPVERIRQYRRIRVIREGMNGILSNLSVFLGKRENIYGFDIREFPLKELSTGSLPSPGLPALAGSSIQAALKQWGKGADSIKILTGEVYGGEWTITRAADQMNLFIKDYRLEPAAPPLEIPLSGRLREPDTLKWVTRIYLPVY